MNFAETFIRRPVATTLLVTTIFIFGVLGYRLLPVSDLPTVDFPTIQVQANLPGASPSTMAASVATPLEKQFSTIAGVTSISSNNGQGNTNITLQFDLSRDIDSAAQDVQSMIARAARSLPPGMPSPPSYQKVNPADQPILFLTLSSSTMPMSLVDQYAESVLAQRLSMVSGVAGVNVFGAQKFAVRIDVDPTQLASRQIGIDQVAQAIAGANVNRPTGTLYGPKRNFVVQTSGQLMAAEEYRPDSGGLPERQPGAPERSRQRLRRRRKPTERQLVQRDADDLSRDLSASRARTPSRSSTRSRRSCRSCRSSCRPHSSSASAATDRCPFANRSKTSSSRCVLTVFLVVMVIFLFLRNISATIIPSLALPFSIVGTFAVMWAFGYSIDNLSLMALTLSVGFVVDDAIVMLENIVRHMEMGKPRLQAALDGSKEIAFTIVSMTLSLAAVFIPILFMGGIVGRLMHEFAVTIAAAILVSGLVSLTLTPMLCSRFLKPPHSMRHGRLYNAIEGVFDRWLQGVRLDAEAVDSLQGRRRWWCRRCCSSERSTCSGSCRPASSRASTPASSTARSRPCRASASRRWWRTRGKSWPSSQADENVASFTSNVGGFGGGRLNVDLKPREDRKLTADQVIEELRPKFARVPGVRVVLSNPPAIRIGGMMSRAQYQFSLQDPDTEELYRVAPGFETALRNVPGLLDVNSDLQIKNPELAVTLDREQIAALGLTVDQVELGAVVGLRIAPDLADLRARRRIPGHHAGRAAIPAGSRGALDALRAGAR